MTRKSTAPDCLRFWVNPPRKAPPAFGDVPRKNVETRWISAFGHSSTKSLSSLRKCTLKKCLRPSASGCLSIPTARLPKRTAAMLRKSTAPDCLRFWVNPPRKAPPAFGDVPRKNVETRWISAFGHSSTKSLSSLRKCTLKKCLRPSASGCLSIPTARLPKRTAAMLRKSAAPDCLRLWVNPFRKISPATCCDAPKKCGSRQPSAFG